MIIRELLDSAVDGDPGAVVVVFFVGGSLLAVMLSFVMILAGIR